MREYNLRKNNNFSKADFYGFTVKRGFYYGYNLRGQAIVITQWQCGDAFALYIKTESGWRLSWIDFDFIFLPMWVREELEIKIENSKLYEEYL